MLKRNKSGQFYLLAAIIIISIIIGFVAISNFAKKDTQTRVNDLGKELGIEGGEVLDFGTFVGQNKINDFTQQYSQYTLDSDREIVFVYGSGDGKVYEVSSKEFSTGGIYAGSFRIPTQRMEASGEELQKVDGNVNVTLNGQVYTFNIKEGENFYFVINQKIGDNNYVVQG